MDMDAEQLPKAFGAVVRELRKAQGFSQEGFADHCKVHRTFMGSLERGESVATLTTGLKVAKGLGISLSQLISHVESRMAPSSQT